MKFMNRFKPKRLRSVERDQATDQNRLNTLSKFLDVIIDEVAFERDGLSKRYVQISEDAGFLMEAAEANPNDDMKNKMMLEYEKNLVLFKSRIKTLNMQLIELNQFKNQLTYTFSSFEKKYATDMDS
jgi:hypothetical protein